MTEPSASTGRPPPRAAVVGIGGAALTAEERALFAELPPAGVILFRRNCLDRAQLRALTGELKALAGDAPLFLLVDQEGGRVMRLAPPHWRPLPAAAAIGALALADSAAGARAAWLVGRLIAHDLREVGLDVACAPVLDVAAPGMTAGIGSRAFGADPAVVAELAAAFADGLEAGGVAPVIKHLPGHGRATVDSHVGLPVVDCRRRELLEVDLGPPRRLRHLPFAMTAHVLYPELDPIQPGTLSRAVIAGTIRGELGFSGLLLSDDLAMHALAGDPATRVLAALAAGCDLALYCPGELAANREVLAAAPPLAASLVARLEGVMARLAATAPDGFAAAAGAAELDALLAGAVA